MKTRIIPQNQMTGECWSVQMGGLEACEKCTYKDTEDCGGENIRKIGKNRGGYVVPIGTEA